MYDLVPSDELLSITIISPSICFKAEITL